MKLRFLKVNLVMENPNNQIYYVVKNYTYINLSEINTIDEINMKINHDQVYFGSDHKEHVRNTDAQVYQAKLKDGKEIDFITYQDFQHE